jgi:hypothetical protein
MIRQPNSGPVIPDPANSHHQQCQGKRHCLSCGRPFVSTGSGNRICRKCKHLDAWKAGIDVAADHGPF